MVTALDVSCDGFGGGFCMGAALGHNIWINVSPTLGVLMVPPNNVGYGLG